MRATTPAMTLCALVAAFTHAKPRNVLLILSDDQRPALNWAYRQSYMHTPNLDRLAQRGFTFGLGYTQYAICAQSRNSFMSSRYPDSIKVYNFIDNFRNATPGGRRVVSGPQAFKQQNYLSLNVGKLYHPDPAFNGDAPLSWSMTLPYEWPVWTGCQRQPHSCNGSSVPACSQPLNTSMPADGYSAFGDWFQKERIVRNLKYAKQQGKPFFLGVGFVRPHGAYQVPYAISDMYPPDGSAFNDTPSPLAPEPLVDIAFTNEFDGATEVCNATTGERWPVGTPTTPIPPSERMRLRQHYFSAVTLVDRFVGEVLDALHELGLENDTAVVFSADHGYQLGDHSTLGKHTLWEASTRIPAVFSVPWLPQSHGIRSSAMYHAVDLFPTMQGLAGLPTSGMPGAEGIDQSPLLAQPGLTPSRTMRQAVFSQYARCSEQGVVPAWKGGADMCTKVDRSLIRWMGYAVRTRDWHLIEWRKFNGTLLEADWTESGVYGRELYDHQGDDLVLIGSRESKNEAGDPRHAALVKSLSALVKSQYDPASPERFQVGVTGRPEDIRELSLGYGS